MNWGSLSAFVAMGGYGAYVWGSFAAVLAAFGVEWTLVRHRRAAVVQSLRRQAIASRLDREMA